MKIISIENENHTYFVKVKKGKYFYEGKARCHEEDYDKENEFFGFDLALLDAKIQEAKHDFDMKRVKVDIIAEFINHCSDDKRWDNNAVSTKPVFKQYQVAMKECRRAEQRFEQCKLNRKNAILRKEAFIKKTNKNINKAILDKIK